MRTMPPHRHYFSEMVHSISDISDRRSRDQQPADAVAARFLTVSAAEIADTFDKRLQIIRQVTSRLKLKDIGFEERLMCLAMIRELSEGLEMSARELLQLASTTP